MSNLDFVFKPKSIAIVGASTREGSVGNDILKNVINGFSGKICPVNPKTNKLLGLKCYPNLESISGKIDLVIIVVPAPIVLSILESVAKLNIKGVIIISAGFKEIGNIEAENKIKEICQKNNIALIGPNCLGILNPSINLNASFAAFSPQPGNISLISQSGALCSAILDAADDLGLGFSKFISIGNKAVLDELDIINYLKNDNKTKTIAIYAEHLNNSEKIIQTARALSVAPNPLPLIILKSGRSLAGSRATASHTGALAGNDSVYEALFRQAGIIRANNSQEFFDYIKIFSNNKIQSASRVAIITNAGGPGVLAVDAVAETNLKLAKLSVASKKSLQQFLPKAASLANPIDVLGDALAERYDYTLKTVLNDKNVDSVLLILTPQSNTEIEKTAEVILKNYKKCKKPLAVVFMGKDLVHNSIKFLQKNNIAVYSYPEAAVKSLSVLENFYQNTKIKKEKIKDFKDVNKEFVVKILNQAKADGLSFLPEALATKVLQAYKLPIIPSGLAKNRKEAEKIAQKIGKNVVLKISSKQILHKSDYGGVILDVAPSEVGDKFDEMIKNISQKYPDFEIDGVLISEMIKDDGLEMILGSVKDPGLGQAVMLGLGGIYVELMKDFVFGVNPLGKNDIYKMIDSLKAKKILDGFRGQEKLDQAALLECTLRFAQLLRDFPEIKEIDINPLLLLPVGRGIKILDIRIII